MLKHLPMQIVPGKKLRAIVPAYFFSRGNSVTRIFVQP